MENLYNAKVESEFLTQISESSSANEYRIKKDSNVKKIIAELNLTGKYFALLVKKKDEIEYKRIDEKHNLQEGEQLVVLPKIAGGGIEKLI